MMISFIIPTYNGLALLKRCLDSLVHQIDANDEIIIIDDGSTDGTFESLESEYSQNKNVVIVRKENGGQGTARNLGIETHRKEYVWFIDSDDTLVDGAVKKIKDVLSGTDYDLLFFDYYMVDQNHVQRAVDLNININDKKNLYLSHHFPWNKVINSQLLKDIRFPEIKIKYEDHATIPKVIAMAKKVGYLQDYLYIYDFSHPNNSSKDAKKEIDIYEVCDILLAFFKENNMIHEVEVLIIKPLLFGKVLTIPKLDLSFKEKYKEYVMVKHYLDKNLPGWRRAILFNQSYNKKNLESVESYQLKDIIAKSFALSPYLTPLALLSIQIFRK